MYLKRILYSDVGRVFISILLGLGLATLFRKVCKDRNCLIFKAPGLDKIEKQIFKFDNECYTYEKEATKCDESKKIVEFA